MEGNTKIPNERDNDTGGEPTVEKEEKLIPYKNKRNSTINFSLSGKNYNAEPGKTIHIPSESVGNPYFQDIKKDFIEVKEIPAVSTDEKDQGTK